MDEVDGEKLEPYKPPYCVWDLIKSVVPARELPLVRSFLGESSIEYCQDLRNELESLLEIWKIVGEQAEPPTVSKPIDDVLCDPPHMREMLTAEIQMLIKGIQEKSGFIEEKILPATERRVIQYAINSQKLQNDSERPVTPLRKLIPEQQYTTSPVKLKHIRKNINAVDIDAVADILKDAIHRECKALERDIEFLQKCVEEEHEVTCPPLPSGVEKPSLLELRQVRKTLESHVLSDVSTNSGGIFSNKIPGKQVDEYYSSSNALSNHNRPLSSTGSRNVQVKIPTPPSPNRIQLRPINKEIRSSSARHFNDPSTSGSRFSYSTLGTPLPGVLFLKGGEFHTSHSLADDKLFEPTECWVERSWGGHLSISPPTTGDSGLGSRPATGNLASIQGRLRHLESNLNTLEDSSKQHSKVDKVLTSNQNEVKVLNNEETKSTEVHETDDHESYNKYFDAAERSRKSVSVPQVKSLKPHPPNNSSSKHSRPFNNMRHPSRKPVKTG